MLFFTFDCDFRSNEDRKAAENWLKERCGEDCIVLPFCTGVYQIDGAPSLGKQLHNKANNIPEVLYKQTEDKRNDRC